MDRINNSIHREYPLPAPHYPANKETGGIPVDTVNLQENPQPEQRQWTILIYSSITPDIRTEGLQSAFDLEKTGSDENVSVILQRGSNNPGQNGNTVRRYYITKDTTNKPDKKELSSPVLDDLGDADMSDKTNLQNFIQMGMKKYPAKHTMIVLGGHSGGFLGAVTDKTRKRLMSLPHIQQAFIQGEETTGKKPDVIAFNSCFMSQGETLSQLKDRAEFIAGSQKPEYGTGMPLGGFIDTLQKKIKDKGTVSPEEASSMLVGACADTPHLTPAVSSIRTEKAEKLEESLRNLSDALIETYTDPAIIKTIIKETAPCLTGEKDSPPLSDYRDLGDFAHRIAFSPAIKDTRLKSAAKLTAVRVKESVSAVFSAGFDDLPENEKSYFQSKGTDADNYEMEYGGISVYLPDRAPDQWGPFTEKIITDAYNNLEFNNRTGWMDFIRKLYE